MVTHSAPTLADHLRQNHPDRLPVIRWRPLKCADATVPFQKGFQRWVFTFTNTYRPRCKSTTGYSVPPHDAVHNHRPASLSPLSALIPHSYPGALSVKRLHYRYAPLNRPPSRACCCIKSAARFFSQGHKPPSGAAGPICPFVPSLLISMLYCGGKHRHT